MALFNDKGGVGKTTLAYHLAHVFARFGRTVLAADLDPQANLTALFVDDDELERLWGGNGADNATVAGAVHPVVQGIGDVATVPPRQVADNLYLLPGDPALGRFEERLAQEWPATLAGGNDAATRATTAFHRLVACAAGQVEADLVLVDIGSNLGALSRSALLLADHVVVPLGADLVSARGLLNLGPTLHRWKAAWHETALPRVSADIDVPRGGMRPLGYVVMQPSMRLDRQGRDYRFWANRVSQVYAEAVGVPEAGRAQIGSVRNFRSLTPLAHHARKPMFDLRPADGAIGSTLRYVQLCLQDFRNLAGEILRRIDTVGRP